MKYFDYVCIISLSSYNEMIFQFSKRCNMNKLWKCIILSLGAIIIGKVDGISAEKAIKRPELFVQQDKNSKRIKLDAAEFRWKKLAPNLFSYVNPISKSYSWEESNKFKIKMQKHFISQVRTFLTDEKIETLSVFVKWMNSNFYTNKEVFVSLLEQFLTNQSVVNFSNIDAPNLEEAELKRLGKNLAILVRDMGELISHTWNWRGNCGVLRDAFDQLYDDNVKQNEIYNLLYWNLIDLNGNFPYKGAVFWKSNDSIKYEKDEWLWTKAKELLKLEFEQIKTNPNQLWKIDLLYYIVFFVDTIHYEFHYNTPVIEEIL